MIIYGYTGVADEFLNKPIIYFDPYMVHLDKILYRAITFFCKLEGMTSGQIFSKLQKHFKSFHWTRQTITNWLEEMNTELDIFPKKSQAGRTNNDELEQKIRDELKTSPTITGAKLALMFKKQRSVIRHYIYDVIGLERVKAFSIPHELTENLRLQRIEFGKVQLAILKASKQVNYRNIITGDESWFRYTYSSLYYYCFKDGKRPQVVKDHRANYKIMLTIFFNSDGPLLVYTLDRNQTITSDRMEKIILPKLHNAYQEYLRKLGPTDRTAINNASEKAIYAASDEMSRQKKQTVPPLQVNREVDFSDMLFLTSTPLPDEESENKVNDDYYKRDEKSYILIDDDDEDNNSKSRSTKTKCTQLLAELAMEENKFEVTPHSKERELHTKPRKKSRKGVSVTAEEVISLLPVRNVGKAFLHMDNAAPHNTAEVRRVLSETGFIRMPHPPNSPDLAPCDFYLFSKLKSALENEATDKKDTLLAAVDKILSSIPLEEWRKVFDSWQKRLEWIIEHQGDYYPAHLKEAKEHPTSSSLSQAFPSEGRPVTPPPLRSPNPELHDDVSTPQSNSLTPETQRTPNASPSSTSTEAEDLVRCGVVCFANLGNSCYLNSLLQCLQAIIPVSNFFRTLQMETLQNTSSETKIELLQLMQQTLNSNWIPTGLKEEPVIFIDTSKPLFEMNVSHIPLVYPENLRNYISIIFPEFELGIQADQHHLFTALVQQLVCLSSKCSLFSFLIFLGDRSGLNLITIQFHFAFSYQIFSLDHLY